MFEAKGDKKISLPYRHTLLLLIHLILIRYNQLLIRYNAISNSGIDYVGVANVDAGNNVNYNVDAGNNVHYTTLCNVQYFHIIS